jgi:fucose permease
MRRQLLLLLLACLGGAAIALLAGAKNLGTAMGIGQLCFAAMLVYVLLRTRRD